MNQLTEEDWDIEITSENSLFTLGLKDVWQYRDLLVLLVRRDFVSFYKQTILGPIWFFVQPVITILIYNGSKIKQRKSLMKYFRFFFLQ